jgi:transposase
MDRKTASRYLKLGRLPSEVQPKRPWRTRIDPFADDWPAIAARLQDAPELEAKALFEHLLSEKPGQYEPGQVRTLQRRVKQWRAKEGPDKEVFFAQEHRPGEAMQTDFTSGNELQITIKGVPFEHMLCQSVLPYSNWQWATKCRSESLLALKRQMQQVFFKLGRVSKYSQTDNTTAATHDVPSGKRKFNEDYEKFVKYFGMEPRTIAVGKKEQNGDIEAQNGALKRRLKQHLILRGSRDFDSEEDYEQWVQQVCDQANQLRTKKVAEELAMMRVVNVTRLLEYTEENKTVSGWSTIRVKHNSYSVPSRLIGEEVKVRVYEDRLEVWYGGDRQLTMERLLGRNKHRIDYRHIIWSLVQKPGAFERYKYREELFPTLTFRRSYDALAAAMSGWDADVDYLRILHLSASTMEAEVEAALQLLLEQQAVPRIERVKALLSSSTPEVPDMPAYEVDLGDYDALLSAEEVAR